MNSNIYVNNTKELNSKIQEYQISGYSMISTTENSAVMSKKNFNMAVFLLLFLFVFMIGGIIYYLLVGDDDTVNIIVDNNRSFRRNNNVHNKVCLACGELISSSQKFCSVCGKKVPVISDIDN